jgi:D-3-phosphoglycerate dehydrogenase
MKKKVLVGATNYSENCAKGRKLLEENGFEVIENPHQRPLTREEQLEYISGIYGVSSGNEIWDREILSKAKNLKIISRFGVGYDNIDVQACKEFGITVSIARGLNGAAVANMAVGLILALYKRIPMFDRTTREGKWVRKMGTDLDGKRVGLLGFGDIAQKTAKRLSGFEVELIAYDINWNEEKARELSVARAELDELLATCDVVSCHLPNLPETRGFMDIEKFKKMKPSAIFINTSRGPLVKEEDLYVALKDGVISGAAIDVYNTEPVPTDNPLLSLENIICTPHTAAESYEAFERVGLNTATDIVNYFNGKNPYHAITSNPF